MMTGPVSSDGDVRPPGVGAGAPRSKHGAGLRGQGWPAGSQRRGRGKPPKKVRQPEKRFLTRQQVADLAEACGPEYRLLVLFLAYTGLRWCEMAALRVHRLDFLRRRALVAESVTPCKV
jgi:integrase